jgi:Metallo-beta-lactamase superfamily
VEALSQSANTLGCASGSWRIWSLSDGYVDLPAGSLRYPNNKVRRQTEPPQRDASLVRLSVNCFLFDRSGIDRVLIDCGAGGSWDPSMGHLVEAMAEAGIDTSSVTMIALTHAHGDHINGLLMPDGRRAFNGLRKIVIGEDAVEEFLAEPVLEGSFVHSLPQLTEEIGWPIIYGRWIYLGMLGAIWVIFSTLTRTMSYSAATLSTFPPHSFPVPSLPGPMTMTKPWRGLAGSSCSRTQQMHVRG